MAQSPEISNGMEVAPSIIPEELPNRAKPTTHYVSFTLLAVVGAWWFFSNLSGTLSMWDEAYYGAVAKESLERGSFLFPAVLPDWRTDKPALYFWILDASFRLFGTNSFALRFPSSAGAYASFLLLYLIARRFYGVRVGVLAALILLTNREFHAYPRNSLLDPLMLGFQMGYVWCAIQGAQTRPRHIYLGAILVGLAFFLKQQLGLIVLGPTLFYWWWSKEWPKARGWVWLGGFGLFLLIGCGWYAYASFYDPTYIRSLLFGSIVFNRFTVDQFPDLWYWVSYFTDPFRHGLHPIVYLGALSILWCWVEWFRKPEGGVILFGIWLCGLLLLLHFTTFRSPQYSVPLYPCFALLIALIVNRLWTAEWNGIDLIAIGWGAAYLLLSRQGAFLAGLPFGTPLGKAIILGGLVALAFLPKWPFPRAVRSVSASILVALALWLVATPPLPADNGPETFDAIETPRRLEGPHVTIHSVFFGFFHLLWYHDGPSVLSVLNPDETLPIPEGSGYMLALDNNFSTWPKDRYEKIAEGGIFDMVRFHPAVVPDTPAESSVE